VHIDRVGQQVLLADGRVLPGVLNHFTYDQLRYDHGVL
jgi:hypothetical protein